MAAGNLASELDLGCCRAKLFFAARVIPSRTCLYFASSATFEFISSYFIDSRGEYVNVSNVTFGKNSQSPSLRF